MPTLYIRNVDSAALAKIDEIAKKRNISRSKLIRDMLSKYTILDIENELDNKYAQLVTLVTEAITINSEKLEKLTSELKESNNDE